MTKSKSLLIITGLSGAGKHQVLYQLEDFGYFCVDNLPVGLLVSNLECLLRQGGRYSKLAIGVDIRTADVGTTLERALDQLTQKKILPHVLFLEAEETELVRRFAETRRPHPLNRQKTLSQRICEEQRQLLGLRERADYIIDTTRMTHLELRSQLAQWLRFTLDQVRITISSFGYKFGIPKDADMVWDMRCLPNPFYDQKLKALTGKNPRVQKFVLGHSRAKTLLVQMDAMVRKMLPGYIQEGKFNLHIALGCTGGQHRSVAMAIGLSKRLPGQVSVHHRELEQTRGGTRA